MQINGLNPSGSNIRIKQEGKNNKNINNNKSFKGLGFIDTAALGVANAIENGGLAVSFTMQDMLGTNLPRPIMGLTRNSKENKGEKNLKFAAKEMVREFTTGPSMFLIPMGMLGIGKRTLGKTVSTPVSLIKGFGEIHSKTPVNEAGKAISKTEFYKNTFTEIIKNAKAEETASDATVKKAGEFAEKLADATKAGKKEFKKTVNNLFGEFTDIVKGHATDAANTDFTKAVINKNVSAPFKNTVEHMTAYADDIVAKATQTPTADAVKKLVNKKSALRFGANIAMYATVMTFLQIIPRMYNKAEGKDNAGLKGLMTEETLKNSTPAENQNGTKDKSKPSFGSSAAFADRLAGNGLLGKFAKSIEYSGPNVSFPLLVGIMGFGILAPRIKNAKDKYDKQEIVRRDVTTCAVMCFGEKALRKCFSKLNETTSGFVSAIKPENLKEKSIFGKIFNYIRPIKGVNTMNTPQIVSKYSGLEKYKDGISGFCEFIDKQGGNLQKVFSLTDESKGIVSDILKKEGKEFSKADNKAIKEALDKAKNTDSVKNLMKLFEGTTKETNPWIRKVQTQNARFTALSVCVLVPVFLGFMLPWINEKATKKQIKEENGNKIGNNNNSQFQNAKFFIKDRIQTNIFSDMKR